MEPIIWLALALCISQSATLSGLNLALFSVGRLELEVELAAGNKHARRVHALRADSSFLLATILWGNVAVNVLLALLSGSVLAGVAAFFFSTVVITIVGEIIPQAYFSRHALPIAATLAPLVRLYQVILFPVAKPTGLVLDYWLGPEGVRYLPERDIRSLLRLHMEAAQSDIERLEGQGALNFLELDDIPLAVEGSQLDPDSVIELEFTASGRAVFPAISRHRDDPFLQAVGRSGRKWVVLVDSLGDPRLLLNTGGFLREALFSPAEFAPAKHCHRPILVREPHARLGSIIPRLRVDPEYTGDDVVDDDVILLWTDQQRIITGSDVLGRLLRGIVRVEEAGTEL